ncbi:MFS transporter [Rhodococcus wratislaviensis]|uniref:MFS transporter n=1 Tax=Rhodococcus wratislaviensis TaxID=44752 RepID=UPI0036606070
MSVGYDSVQPPDRPHAPSPNEVRRVAVSGFLGNTIEYYDFILYGSAAALFIGPLFFSGLSPAVGTLVSFATLATGYVARPLGGIVFGRLGDRIGRKPVLLITMVVMGVGSGLIGVLPTYTQIGVAAPLLLVLLRLVQGFAIGGEWGGAALLTAEHAPDGRRGFFTAIAQSGLPLGSLLSVLAMAAVSLLPQEQLMTWGWRLPFLVSFLMLGVGLYVRTRISESPLFDELDATAQRRRRPLTQILRRPGALFRGVAATIPPVMGSTLFGSFVLSYAVGIGYTRSEVLVALGIAWAASIVTTPLYGMLSDRIGRRPVYLFGALGLAVLAFPVFWAINSLSTTLLVISLVVVFALVSVAMSGPLAALLSEMFSTDVRYTGVSLSYQVATIIAGFTPLLAGSLLALAGGGRNVGLICAFVAVVSLLAASIALFWMGPGGGSLRSVRIAQPEPEPALDQ